MSSDPGFEEFETPSGVSVWTVDMPVVLRLAMIDIPFEKMRMRRIIALTADALYFSIFAPHHDMASAIKALKAGEDVGEVLGRTATKVRLADIDRVERLDWRDAILIHSIEDGKARKLEIWTPKRNLFGQVFDAVQKRLGSGFQASSQPAGIENALSIDPVLAVCALPIIFIAMAGIIGEDASKEFGLGHTARLAKLIEDIGVWIGPTGGWLLITALVLAIVAAILVRVFNRPTMLELKRST